MLVRAVVAVLASLSATLTKPNVPNGDLRLLVPAYFSLGGSGSCSDGKLQGDFVKLAEGGSRVTAILRWEDKDCVKPLRSKHVSLLGYVDVDYESWNANYVADQIRIWQNEFPSTDDLVGLYFGRLPPWEAGGSIIDSVLALITGVTKWSYYLVAEPGGLSGGLIPPQYLDIFSSFVAFNQAGPNSEGHGAWYNGSAHGVCPTPSFVKSPAPKNYCKGKQICDPQGRSCRTPKSSSQMCALVFSQPQLSQSTIDAAHHAGYQGGMFISDAGYTRLPSYWSDEPGKF